MYIIRFVPKFVLQGFVILLKFWTISVILISSKARKKKLIKDKYKIDSVGKCFLSAQKIN